MKSIGLLTFLFLAPLAAQVPTPALAAISIKPSAAGGGRMGPDGGMTMMMRNATEVGRISLENITLEIMIEDAWSLKPYQVIGPSWLNDVHFDVSATANAPVPKDQMLPLMKPALIGQFKLKTHTETREMDALTLTVAKGGLKIRPSSPAEVAAANDPANDPARGRAGGMLPGPSPDGGPGGGLHAPPGSVLMGASPSGVSLNAGVIGMDQLVALLSHVTGKPVLDATGLTGKYDISLNFSPEGLAMMGGRGGGMSPGPPPGGDASADAPAPAPNLFAALQYQLGLKLESRKEQVPVLVIDSAERAPVGQ